MPYSKPITIQRLLNAPIDEPDLLPPRRPGVYLVTLKEWAGGKKLPSDGVIYVGQTSKGDDPQLLYRIAGLLMDATGFSEEPDKRGGFFHSGGHSIWRAFKEGSLVDPRKLYISWNSECCPVCEENRVYRQFKSPNRNGFLGKSTPPKCLIKEHLLAHAK